MTWLVNPFTNHVFVPFAVLLLALFSSAACALFIIQQVRLGHDGRSSHVSVVFQQVLWQRYRIWAIIGILFVAAAFCGPLVMAALCAFLCWQGALEYATLTELSHWHAVALVLGGLLT